MGHAMQIKTRTLIALLRQRALLNTSSKAYTFLSQHLDVQDSLTYGDLHRHAEYLSWHIQQQCKPGDRVLLLFNHGPQFIVSFFACLYAGVVAVPIQALKGQRDLTRLQVVGHDTNPRLALSTADLLSKLDDIQNLDEFKHIHWHPVDLANKKNDFAYQSVFDGRSDAIAYLQYTSGSTTQPRGVMITHENVLSNLEAIDEDFYHSEQSVGLTWLPHFHDMGLVYGLLQPLFNGYPCYVLSPASFVQNPFCWLEAITKYKATHSGGPNFAYDLCTRKISPVERAKLELSSWLVAFNGAETVRRETIDRFAKAFNTCGFRRESFYAAYGLAEATLKVTGKQLIDSAHEKNDNEAVSCGPTPPHTQIRIVD